jgi:hypothetical protein
MSMHRGTHSLGSGITTVEITTTLYELMESMGDRISSLIDLRRPRAEKKNPARAQDRMIASRVAGMFLSGRIRFKRPGDVFTDFPEWVE